MSRILFIGGTGEISHSCVLQAVRDGHSVSVLNRGFTSLPLSGVEQIYGDVLGPEPYAPLSDRHFDVICQFLAFEPDEVARDLKTLGPACEQYIFISSATVYRKPWETRITEDTPRGNVYSSYAQQKAACEDVLVDNGDHDCQVTIVRPSHTYARRLPGAVTDGAHQAWRLVTGRPVIVHDDGASLWTLTHAADFARAMIGLCGNSRAFGEAFHITCEHSYSWNDILARTGAALGVEPTLRYVTSEALAAESDHWRSSLSGDKANNTRFDNAKVRSVIGDWRCSVSLDEGLQKAADLAHRQIQNGYRPPAEQETLIENVLRKYS